MANGMGEGYLHRDLTRETNQEKVNEAWSGVWSSRIFKTSALKRNIYWQKICTKKGSMKEILKGFSSPTS